MMTFQIFYVHANRIHEGNFHMFVLVEPDFRDAVHPVFGTLLVPKFFMAVGAPATGGDG